MAVVASRWQPGRLLIGWSLGVLTTLGLLTAAGGFYEYRQLSSVPGIGTPSRTVAGLESACLVDKVSAIDIGGFEVVPGQPDGCYVRRPRIRPWQWVDGIKDLLGRFATTARAPRHANETSAVRLLDDPVAGAAGALTHRVSPLSELGPGHTGEAR